MVKKFVNKYPYLLYIYIFKGLKIATININGLNKETKQLHLLRFLKYQKIDVVLIQEHNIRKEKKICEELLDEYHVEINYSIALKGGTAILINKRTPINIINVEKSANSRIMSVKIKLYDQMFNIVNVYANADSNKERDLLFTNELPYYLRNSMQCTILGGDFNCVLSERDRVYWGRTDWWGRMDLFKLIF